MWSGKEKLLSLEMKTTASLKKGDSVLLLLILMKCIGRTKSLLRCRKRQKFILCKNHIWQPALFIVALASFIDSFTGKHLWSDYIKPYLPFIHTADAYVMEPFDTTKGSYNVLLLPFQPLQKCQYKKTDIENTIITRLRDLNEKDTLNLQVKYDTLDCIHSYAEANSLGKKLKADLVIWGDLYDHCSNDTNEACLKFVNISTGKKGESQIEKMASLSEVKEGKLQKDIDYIIYWVQGSKAFANENYTRALILFKHSEVAHKDNEELLFALGVCNHELKIYAEAKKYYEKILNLNANFSEVHNNYAILLKTYIKDFEGAKKHYEIALKLDPNNAIAHYNYALFLENNFKDFEGAKNHYEIALDLDSNRTEAHFNYAILLKFNFDDFAEAKKHFEKTLDLNPNDAGAHYGYAFLLEENFNDYPGAKFHYEKALEIKPDSLKDYALAQVNYAYLLDVRYNKHEEAIKHYKKGLEIDPNAAKAQLDYTVSLKNDGKPAGEILKHYKIAIQLDPTLRTLQRDKDFGLKPNFSKI